MLRIVGENNTLLAQPSKPILRFWRQSRAFPFVALPREGFNCSTESVNTRPSKMKIQNEPDVFWGTRIHWFIFWKSNKNLIFQNYQEWFNESMCACFMSLLGYIKCLFWTLNIMLTQTIRIRFSNNFKMFLPFFGAWIKSKAWCFMQVATD